MAYLCHWYCIDAVAYYVARLMGVIQKKTLKVFIVAAAVVAVGMSYAFAARLGPVDFSDQQVIEGLLLRLNGAGLKKFINFKVVAVALYLPSDVAVSDPLGDIAKHLEVVYLINIPKQELDRATDVGIKKNVNPYVYRQLKQRIDQMNSYYEDVHYGDRIGVSFIPGVGTRVSFNGQVRGIIKGNDFARAFFAIWIGSNPVDPAIKKKLLGM